MVTLIGFIKSGNDYEITEFERIRCKSKKEAIEKARVKCMAKQWNFYQVVYN